MTEYSTTLRNEGSIIKSIGDSAVQHLSRRFASLMGTDDISKLIKKVNCLDCQIKQGFTLSKFNALSIPSKDTTERYSHYFNISYLDGLNMMFNKYPKGLMKKSGLNLLEHYRMNNQRMWLSLSQSNRINENRDFDEEAFYRAYELCSIFIQEFTDNRPYGLTLSEFKYKLAKFYKIGLESNKTDGIFFNYIPKMFDAPLGFVVQNKRVYLFVNLPFGRMASIAALKTILRALTESLVNDIDELDSQFLFKNGYMQLRRNSYYSVRTFLRLIYNKSIGLLPAEFLMKYAVEVPKMIPESDRLYSLISKNNRNKISVSELSDRYNISALQAELLRNPIYERSYKMSPTTRHTRYGEVTKVTHTG